MPLNAKIKQRLISRTRREWHWSKEKRDALKMAKRADKYACNKCKKHYDKKFVQVDHIDPVIDPAFGWQGWDVYIERMFCPVENLQVLCKACHHRKSCG